MKEKRTAVVTIKDLAEAFNSTDHMAYKNMLKQEGVSDGLKAVLTKPKDKSRYSKNLENQQHEVEVIEKVIFDYEKEAKQHEKECNKACDEYDGAKMKYEAAKRIMERQQRKIEEAEAKIHSETMKKKKAEEQKQEMETLLTDSNKKLEQMKKFVLVHPTATLGSLDKSRWSVLIATKFDVMQLRYKRFADEIIDTADDPIYIPEGAREKFETEEEFKSAVEYTKLVVRYWAEDKPYELLYNSEGIKYMLEQTFR